MQNTKMVRLSDDCKTIFLITSGVDLGRKAGMKQKKERNRKYGAMEEIILADRLLYQKNE